jgi:hypothetical protein
MIRNLFNYFWVESGADVNESFRQISDSLQALAQDSNASGRLLSGTGVPSPAIGADGSYYFRTDATSGNHIYYKSGGVWTAIV